MQFLDVIKVFLHPVFEGLLSAANVGFAGDFAFDFIYNNSSSAYVIIVAFTFVSGTVAVPVFEV